MREAGLPRNCNCGRRGRSHDTLAVRGDGAGIHTLDSAHDKAYTSVSFKNDTIALVERTKGEEADCTTRQATACHVYWRWSSD